MNYFSKKQWFLAWLTDSTIALSIAGVTQAQEQPYQGQSKPLPRNHPDARLDPNLLNVPPMPEPSQERSLSQPLPRNHPDARLDPNLLNVPPMPEPQENISPTVFSNEIPAREISYDISTGSIQIGGIGPIQHNTSPSMSSPNLGADFNIEPEPNADSQ